MDPDQDRQNVGPNLGPNCLQCLSADHKKASSKERVKGRQSHGMGQMDDLFSR